MLTELTNSFLRAGNIVSTRFNTTLGILVARECNVRINRAIRSASFIAIVAVSSLFSVT
jgi:hypothetical protein